MLSIIIVNFRTWAFTQRAIDFLLSSLPSDIHLNQVLEIVVVDNHSNDWIIENFSEKNPGIRVLLSDGNHGYSYGCNYGALHAGGNWLLFMNPDVLADWKSLNKFFQAAKADNKHSIFTARQINKAGKPQRTFAPFTRLWTLSFLIRALVRTSSLGKHPEQGHLQHESERILTVDWASGSLILMSQATFNKLNGWNKDFWLFCEDEDLCRRAHDLGLLTAQYYGATFVHLHASSTRTTPEIRVLTKSEAIISKFVYIHKHLDGLERRLAAAWMRMDNYASLLFWAGMTILTLGFVCRIKEQFLIRRRVAKHILNSHKNNAYLSDKSKKFATART
jgi:hypothetical protein